MDFIDAPVSGSVKPAEDGTLIIMAGGSLQAYERAKPIFDVIGKLTMHLGDNGAGTSAKLAINYLLGLNLQGLAETVLFAKQNGIKTEDMLTIINEGACGNAITRLKSSNIKNNNFTAAFALKHLTKDLRLAGDQGLQTPLYAPLFKSYQDALKQGLGDEDCVAIYKYLSHG
jgi:3-hydroxyisobutyrate dehydrogenase